MTTRAQNAQNISPRPGRQHSKYRGVTWNAQRGKWQAKGTLAGKTHHLHYFDDEQEAAQAAKEWRARNLPYAAG